MLSLVGANSVGFAPAIAPIVSHGRASTVRMESLAELKGLAEELNPTVGFW